MTRRPAVFFDRDGTLIHDCGYLSRVDQIQLYPYAIEALHVLQRAGFALVITTNQAGVAKGVFDEPFVGVAHQWLRERFEAAGVQVAGFYYCPHHPDGVVPHYRRDCDCRKPRPGMAQRAAAELGLDLGASFVIGDKWLDVGVANAVGARGILVRTGYGATDERRPEPGVHAAAIVDHVHEAATWILAQAAGRRA